MIAIQVRESESMPSDVYDGLRLRTFQSVFPSVFFTVASLCLPIGSEKNCEIEHPRYYNLVANEDIMFHIRCFRGMWQTLVRF
ncbi:hypothetical protein [Nostoc commune]|uniref:hypothetical protein n=1 Tax=Nostoc commune TaxID=1178 RepID=UPI00207321B1|nr:hypothetical protein [Nostoc commune]